MNTTTYQPLTLTQHKDGHRYGTVTPNLTGEPVEYTVKVESHKVAGTTHYNVSVVGGDLKDFRSAGVVTRRGSTFHVASRKADGHLSPGYDEHGTLVSNVQRVVFEYLNSVDYAQREAAKSPEQKAEEAAAHRAAVNEGRNKHIARKAQEFLDMLDREVPESTVHYAVEGARAALKTLIFEAGTQATIKTSALVDQA